MARSLNLITFITIYAPSVPPPDVFPQQIEGVKMILNKTLSSFFKVTLPFTLCIVAYLYMSCCLIFNIIHLFACRSAMHSTSALLVRHTIDSTWSICSLMITARIRSACRHMTNVLHQHTYISIHYMSL